MSDDEGNYIGALAGVQNITERKEAEEALERSESKYRALVESSPDGVLSVGDDGHILDCNESICQLLGYTKEEIIGTSFRDLLSKAAAEDLLSYRAQLAHSRQVEQEFEMTHRSGKAVAVWAKMVPLQEGGDGISRVVVYLRDTEERKKLSQLKDEFIGLVSHELRSPLTVIIGAINTALTEETRLSAEESHHLLQDAAIEAESLSHLVGNLLELSRVQADQLTLYTEPSNLDAAVQSVVDKLKRTYPSHTFVVDISHETPPITADQLRLERILFNLMDNAAKYSSEGTEISVFARQDSEHLIVGVSDQGIGITPHDQAKLFAPFQRLEDYRSDGARGAGLGLLVCRRLVEAHGGRIWVESEPGRGSTFFFALPLGQRPGR
jgi:PAS domain S-box-containing protein